MGHFKKAKRDIGSRASSGAQSLVSAANKAAQWGQKIGSEALDVAGVVATEGKKKLKKYADKAMRLGE